MDSSPASAAALLSCASSGLGHLHRREKSRVCPHHLALKSLILARTECSFVGQALDSPVDSLVVRDKLGMLDDDAVCMYFVRRHVNRVAQSCQDAARRSLLQGGGRGRGGAAGGGAAGGLGDDLSLSSLYRNLVC